MPRGNVRRYWEGLRCGTCGRRVYFQTRNRVWVHCAGKVRRCLLCEREFFGRSCPHCGVSDAEYIRDGHVVVFYQMPLFVESGVEELA